MIRLPLFFPIAMQMGIDPLHLGIIMVLVTLIGLMVISYVPAVSTLLPKLLYG